MPNNTRGRLRRKLQQAADLLDNVNLHLTEVAYTFKDHHPDKTEKLSIIMAGIKVMQETIQKFNSII